MHFGVVSDANIAIRNRATRRTAARPSLLCVELRQPTEVVLAKGGKFAVLAGNWEPDRIVLFKWPSLEALRAFMFDPDYLGWKRFRESVSTANDHQLIERL